MTVTSVDFMSSVVGSLIASVMVVLYEKGGTTVLTPVHKVCTMQGNDKKIHWTTWAIIEISASELV